MKHTIELTYEELVDIVAEKFGITSDRFGLTSTQLEVKITNTPATSGVDNTLWYPDDSGEWIEHYGDDPPEDLRPEELVYWIVPKERANRVFIAMESIRVDELQWDCVQAYKKV